MKILLGTCMYKRPLVSELFLLHYHVLKAQVPYALDLMVVGSDNESARLCKIYGANYFTEENLPLGRKFNMLLQLAMNLDFDYFLLTGSDDLIAPQLFDEYKHLFDARIDYFGVSSVYFYDPKKNIALEYNYPFINKLVGCGRCFSKDILRKIGQTVYVRAVGDMNLKYSYHWKGMEFKVTFAQAEYLSELGYVEIISEPEWELWDSMLNKNLDSSSELMMISNGVIPIAVHTERPYITDVKSDENIWPVEHLMERSTQVEPNEAMWFLSEGEKNYLKNNF